MPVTAITVPQRIASSAVEMVTVPTVSADAVSPMADTPAEAPPVKGIAIIPPMIRAAAPTLDAFFTLARLLIDLASSPVTRIRGCFFGLRISDLKTLRWEQILEGNSFELLEKKTGKRRIVRINAGFQKHIKDCYKKLKSPDMNQFVFLSREHQVYSTQRINVIFKEVKKRYGIKINHFSTHSLRKTFGRKVVDSAGNDSEMGLRQEEIGEVYDGLEF